MSIYSCGRANQSKNGTFKHQSLSWGPQKILHHRGRGHGSRLSICPTPPIIINTETAMLSTNTQPAFQEDYAGFSLAKPNLVSVSSLSSWMVDQMTWHQCNFWGAFIFSFCILYFIGYGWLNSIWHQCTGWASHWCQDFLETTSGGPFQSLPLQNWLTHWQVEPNFTKLEWNRCGHCSKDQGEWSKIKYQRAEGKRIPCISQAK